MPKAILRFENERFESLFRRFKRSVEKDGILQEVRRREYFEKPSLKRKRADAAAKKRQQKINEIEKMTLKERAQLAKQEEKKRSKHYHGKEGGQDSSR